MTDIAFMSTFAPARPLWDTEWILDSQGMTLLHYTKGPWWAQSIPPEDHICSVSTSLSYMTSNLEQWPLREVQRCACGAERVLPAANRTWWNRNSRRSADAQQ